MSGFRGAQFFGAPALVGLWRQDGSQDHRRIRQRFVSRWGIACATMRRFALRRNRLRIPIVIVGGGMAGLNAAWHLDKRGFHDFVLLEMERQAGGNSRWGENEISKFPWAAHYVPVPPKGESLARELFEELGVLRDGKWDERALCFDPQERLFINGHWQEGIEPEDGATARDREQFRRFQEMINAVSRHRPVHGSDGTRREAIAAGSACPWPIGWRSRDSIPRRLRWYINYACRDDYGALAKNTSAWAGIQYFASREPEEKGPLTWPEGNGWIAGAADRKS